MAAAQCRSNKCTAERKGFRRELDSWRHTLIHCVGFESILEGIYGPLLLQDLNIFDDCEPEDVDDWSIEASCSYCSFCNLPLDKLADQCPAAASPLSSPSEYSPSQAPNNSESSLTAHKFLQAVFHKKDVPLNCDPNIPLVAQELMKKMIHQFALEYASKSHLHTTMNGPSTDTSSSLSDDADPDAPLDLTVNRKQETTREPLPDGVLDLSKRNSACSVTSSSSNHKVSGFPLAVTEELKDPVKQEVLCEQSSALEAVFRSLCPAHRSLLYQILKLAHQERLLSSPQQRPASQNESHCCHHGVVLEDNTTPLPFGYSDCKPRGTSPHYSLSDCDHTGPKRDTLHPADSNSTCSVHPYRFTDCKSQATHGSGCCCVQSCSVAAYPVICLKSLHCIACQSLAVGRINKVVCSFASSPSLSTSPSLCSTSSRLCPSSSVCPASSLCCNHHSHPCHCYSNHTRTQAVEGGPEDGDPPCPVLKREQSPSPPPLSPIPSDINRKMEEKPPSLQHHREDMSLHLTVKDVPAQISGQDADLDIDTEEECMTPKRDWAEQSSSGRLLQDVVERFNEKLETIKPQEKDPLLSSSTVHKIGKQCPLKPQANQSIQSPADEHLSEIITTVLHKGTDSDYNLSELLHQHDSSEAKSPNTRSRRRQEALAPMTMPLDPATTRRRLKIKRELAMLDQSYCKRMQPKRMRLKDGNNVTSETFSSSSDITPPEEKPERVTGIQEAKELAQEQEMVKITAILDTESDMMGVTGGKELVCVTEKKEGKNRLGKWLKDSERQEEELSELKEEIETVIVTEEIEINTIKLEVTEKKIATEREDNIAPDTQVPTNELQSKSDILFRKKETPGCSSACDKDGRNQEHASSGQCDSDNIPARSTYQHRLVGKRRKAKCQPGSSRQAGRSRRNIVPPQRFSSYVTEPRKMYFVACFSESIFNQRPTKDSSLNTVNSDTCLTKDSSLNTVNSDTCSINPSVMDHLPESRDTTVLSSSRPTGDLAFESTPDKQLKASNPESKEQRHVIPETLVATEKSPSKPSTYCKRDVATRSNRRLQSLSVIKQKTEASRTRQKHSKPRSCSFNIPDTCVQTHHTDYTSPIKLMYVSPVMGEKGLTYSLKSAASASSGQVEEAFDPYEESSWAGSPEKAKCPVSDCAKSPIKSSPLNSATSSPKSISAPSKSVTTPPKSVTTPPKSLRTSPKSVGTPPKSLRTSTKSVTTPPKSLRTSPKSVTTPSKSLRTSPKSVTTPPKSIRTSPKSVATPPKSIRTSPKSVTTPPKSIRTSPKSVTTPPKSIPKSVTTPPKSIRTSPKSVSTPPKSTRTSPKSVTTPPKSVCTSPKSVGTPPKSLTTSPKSVDTPPKSVSTPPKSLTSSPKSVGTPPKSASSPARSVSLSPKVGARRSGDCTPPKRTIGAENHKTDVPLAVHETTPPKRRPGRPKKLGPQLEKKVKRPIGRPRKQKGPDQVKGRPNTEHLKSILESNMEEKTNRNLKITVFYGRSRRNKRLVSESDGQLHTELHEELQCVDRTDDSINLLHSSEAKPALQELNLVRPVKDKESAPHSSSNIKCQSRQGAHEVPMRKPGRPAKVKISGISVTFTPVSPRQRKIQINRDARKSPETLSHKKVQLPDVPSAKEPRTISLQTKTEARDQSQDEQPDRPVAVRHSVRVRKPSIYLLHSVATSTPKSYSHSTALLRRSKQLLLNKASNQRRLEEAQGDEGTSGGKNQAVKMGRKRTCQDVHRVAKISVDSIFPPGDTLRWWAASADENTLNQELARRIRLVSDTWVSDTIENQEEAAFKTGLGIKSNSSIVKRSKHSSMVQMLFDCPPSKPRSCSMQQLCSWFMQTTETQSLSIVKKISSRNPYEHMHYPRSVSNGSLCSSPQAERLRKHIKKFAKTVPKSPSEQQRAQKRILDRCKSISTSSLKRQLFTSRFEPGKLNQGAPWWRGRKLARYPATLLRARVRFLTGQERKKWPKRQRNKRRESKRRSASSLNDHVFTHIRPRDKAFSSSATDLVECLESNYTTSSGDQTDPMSVPKEQQLSSKAWSPETLKECRVFLKKINSPGPDNESAAEEEWDSCTVTLDDGSSSAHHITGKERKLTGENKAVKRGNRKKRKKRTVSKESESCSSKASQEQDEVAVEGQKGKWQSPAVVFEPPQPPPAKTLRQSRVRGLSGPRWCDFVFGS